MTGPSLRRALALGVLLTAAATASARADECMRLVDALPPRTFADGTHTVTLSPPAASLGQWFVTASGDDPAWVEVDGKTVVSPSDLRGPRRDRVTVAVKLRASSKVRVRVPGRHDRLTVRVFGVAPASALPANVGKPVGDVVVFEELLPGGVPARIASRTVTAPGADGVLFLSAEQAGPSPVLLSKLLWNDEAALGATVLRPNCQAIVAPVVAHSTNTLETWVFGLPGSRMRVRLRGWVVDTVAPTATWASPAEGSAAGAGATLRLTWADAGTGVDSSKTTITLNGHDVTSAFTLGAAEATAPFAALPASALVAGTNVLRATVKDRACNAVSVERRFTTGTTPPPDTTPPLLAGTPSNVTVEQTSPLGAVVTYTAPTATDDRDPAPVVTCVPASGSTFTAGTTTVTCTATDAAGNASTSTFTVTVRDTTAPVLSQVPADLAVEQTGPLGAVVTYTAPTVTDAADPTAQVVCTPASGSLFPAGTTTVTCTATDAAGNASTATFTVTVRDTSAPVLSQVPADLTVEQTGPTGAVVTFAAPAAVDAADPAPVVSCVPASGSVFPAGTTTVTCTTRDAAGNPASATFQVTVRDRTAPTFTTGVQDFTVEQTGLEGAIVTYAVPVATDVVDGSVTVQCAPPPGAVFPPGYTLVVCTARDQAGNFSVGQFVVRVQDSTLPIVTVDSPAADATVSPSALLRVTWTDAVGVQTPTLVVRLNGRDVTSLLQVLPTGAQAVLGDLGLESGPVQVVARITDLAGNVGSASSAFTFAIPAAATRLVVEVPPAPASPLQAGQAYDLTLRALTATGDVAVAFTGVVTLTTTDPSSVLNGLVVDFAPEHSGVRTLRGVVQFVAVGPHTVTATSALGDPIEGQLELVVERSERGRVIAVLPSGAYFPGQTFSVRLFVDLGASDGDPSTFQDVLGAYDVRLLYDPRQVEIVRVDPGLSSLGAPLFRLPGSVRLMDLNDLGALSAQVGPDPSATGLVEVASIDLFVREDAPGGALALAVTGDTLTTAVPAVDHTFLLSPVGRPGPLPGELEGQVSVLSAVPAAGLAVIGVIPRDGEGLVAGAQAAQDAWAVLSAPVDPSTLDAVSLARDGVQVAGSAHLGDDARTVRFTPAAPLADGLYTFTVGADLGALGGGPLGQPRVSTFRVGPDPAAVDADLDGDGEVAILDLQVRRDVKGGRTQGTVPDFPPVFLSGTGPVEVGTVAGAEVDLEVVDADGGSVALSGTDLPEGARLERSGDNRFSLTIPGVAAGQSIQLQATDARGETTVVTLRTTSKRTNSAPSLLLRRANDWEEDDVQTRRSAPFRMNEGDVLHFEVEAIDLDFLDPTGADHVAFVPPSLPGVELVSLSGTHGERALYRYQPPFDQEGEREIEFAVHDDEGSSATLRIPVKVEHYDQWPVFEETQDVFFVVAGQTVTLDWIVSDPDGDPVQLALYGETEAALTGNTQLSVVSRVSTPGRLSLTVRILEKYANTTITAVASDGEIFTYKNLSIVGIETRPPYEPPPPRLINYTPSFSAPSPFFTNVTLGIGDTFVLDDPETTDVNERSESGSGSGSFKLVGQLAGQITDLTVTGLQGAASWNWISTRFGPMLNVGIQSDTPFGLAKGETRDGTIEVTAGDEHYSFPIVFLSSGQTTIYPLSIPPPPPDPPEPTPVLELVQLSDVIETTVRVKVRVPRAQFATAFLHGGAALFVHPHPEENPPETPPDRPPTQTGDLVLDLDVYVGGYVTAPIKLQVSYSGALSEELSIDIPLGSRVPGPPVFATYGPDGALRQVATRAPILPEGLRAEDQSISPDNPYVIYLAVPRHPKKVMTSKLEARLQNGTPSLELPAPVATLGVPLRYTDGAVEDDYTVSLPIFLTFRSVSPASMTPVRVLGDRIIVSMGAPRGGSYVGYGGNYEGANDHFEPAFARPGIVQDSLRVEVKSTAEGKPAAHESLEVEGFVPGLCGRPLVHHYTQHAENYLLDGAAVWCSDTIEAWDPRTGLSTLYVDDPVSPTPSALEPEGEPSALLTYLVGKFMRTSPGFLPGPNHVHFGRTSTASPGDLPGTSFDATFQLTTSNRAIPAKTGPGLEVDYSCDGARLGDPVQAAYPQADLMIDDQLNPGVARAGGEVFLATGEEILHRVDLVVPGVPGRPETDFRLERTYRSQIHYNASLGYGWCSDWFEGLQFQYVTVGGARGGGGTRTLTEVWQTSGEARVNVWHLDFSTGEYLPPPGQYGIMHPNRNLDGRPDGTWTLRYPDGRKKNFDRLGLLRSIENRYGDTLELCYDETLQLDYVLDVYGRKVDFDLEPVVQRDSDRDAHYRLRRVTFDNKVIEYEYGILDDLTAVVSKSTNPGDSERREEYAYYSDDPEARYPDDEQAHNRLAHNLWKVTRPEDEASDTPYLTLTYGTEDPEALNFDRVRKEYEGGTNASGIDAGGEREFSYARLDDGALSVTVREPNLAVRQHEIDGQGLTRAVHEQTSDATYTTRMIYDERQLLVFRLNPGGDKETFGYEGFRPNTTPARDRGWQKNLSRHAWSPSGAKDRLSSGQAELVTTWMYEHVYNQVTETTDPRGWCSTYEPLADRSRRGPARYTTRISYDYQESTGEIPDVERFGLIVNVVRGSDDLNGDGLQGQVRGSPVLIKSPSVHHDDGTIREVLTKLRWNEAGQLLASIDPNGHVTEHTYHLATDPDGDGRTTDSSEGPKVVAPRGGGYLKSLIVDSPNNSGQRSSETVGVALQLVTSFLYDPSGNLSSTVDARGVETRMEHDAWNQPIKVTRAATTLQLVTTNEYDRNGWLVATTTGTGAPPPAGSLVTESHSSPVTVRYVRDILGDVRSQTVEGTGQQVTTYFDYDKSRLRTAVRTPHTVLTTRYDGRNRPFEVTRGVGLEASTVTYGYDAAGNLAYVEDAEDTDQKGGKERTTFAYDGFNRLRRTTNALLDFEQLTVDPLGQVEARSFYSHLAPTVPLAETTYAHDELGRVFRTGQRLNPTASTAEYSSTSVVYDAGSRVTREVAPDGTAIDRRYDGAGRLAQTKDGIGNTTTIERDDKVGVVRIRSHEVTPGVGVVDLVYETTTDELGRVLTESDPAANRRRFEYDARGHLRVVTDAEGPLVGPPSDLSNGRGNVTRFDYDSLGRLVRETRELRRAGQGPGDGPAPTGNAAGAYIDDLTVEYDWDEDSRLKAITDPASRRTSFDYDSLSRQTKRTLADGAVYQTSYDHDDNVKTTTDPNASTITRTCDALNRVTEVLVARGPGVVGTRRQSFGYDPLSRLVRSDDFTDTSNDLWEQTYDALGRPLAETQNGVPVTNTWTPDGRRQRLEYPGGFVVDSTFDPVGRVQSLSGLDPGPGRRTAELCRLTWSGPGLRLAQRVVGIPGDPGRETVTAFDYDPALRLDRLTATSPAKTAFVDRKYAYNRASVRTDETRFDDGGRELRRTYDSTYRLEQTRTLEGLDTRRTVSYSFDRAGNRTASTIEDAGVAPVTSAYTTDPVHAYTKIGGVTRAHDRNGNLTDDGTYLYSYDAFDRLTEVRLRSVGANSTPIVGYSYFADGRRAAAVRGAGVNAEVRLYVYDGPQEVAELDRSGRVLSTFVWGPEYVDSLVQFRRGAETYYVHQDAQFNVVAVTDAAGNVVEKRRYDDFGSAQFLDADNNPLLDSAGKPVTSSPIGLDYGFQGRRFDPETGLYYFRARYYDPATGRFISRDPVWDPGNVGNPYTFCGNSPVTGRDPSGEIAWFAAVPIYYALAALAGSGAAIYAGQEAYVQSQTATEYDYGAIGRAGAGGAVIGLAAAIPGGSYAGLAASGIVTQAGSDFARGEMSSAGHYVFAAALGPALKGGFAGLAGLRGAGGIASSTQQVRAYGMWEQPFEGNLTQLLSRMRKAGEREAAGIVEDLAAQGKVTFRPLSELAEQGRGAGITTSWRSVLSKDPIHELVLPSGTTIGDAVSKAVHEAAHVSHYRGMNLFQRAAVEAFYNRGHPVGRYVTNLLENRALAAQRRLFERLHQREFTRLKNGLLPQGLIDPP